MIEFFVHGSPVPQGSKRIVRGTRMIEMAGPRLKDWRQACAGECARAQGRQRPLDGPVSVRVTFYFAHPKAHYRSGLHAKELKPKLPLAPAVRPDIDKLCRAVLDAITGIAFADDGQVSRLWAEKRWADPLKPGVEVSIWPID